MAAGTTYRDLVRGIAVDNYGFVTTKAATAAGVPPVELPKLAARGGLDHVTYGLYRVPDLPAHAFDQFAEALARAGHGAFLHGDSVLALHSLAEVNPRRVRVAVRRRTRPTLPPWIELTIVKDDVPVTVYEGLASQPVAEALLECRGRIEGDRLLAAGRQARAQGLLTTTEWKRVRAGLRT